MIDKNTDEFLSRFITEEVVEIVERSTTYHKVIASKDPEEFMDVTIKQWDFCMSAILCHMRNEFRKERITPTQLVLLRICKLAGRKVFNRHKLVLELAKKDT